MNYKNIIKFEEIDSTNTYAMKNLDLIDDRTIILAEKQTAGRGRFTRTWNSAHIGNVYMTIVLKPSNKVTPNLPLTNLTQYLSVVAAKTLEKYNVKPQIKWPNDVLINGRKLVGILSEISAKGSNLNGIVLGIGINLNMPKEYLESIDRPATALNIELDKEINKDIFLEELLEEFFNKYDEFLERGFSLIKEEYEQRSMFLNKDIKIDVGGKIVTGIATKVNDNGTLTLKNADKSKMLITSGDVLF